MIVWWPCMHCCVPASGSLRCHHWKMGAPLNGEISNCCQQLDHYPPSFTGLIRRQDAQIVFRL